MITNYQNKKINKDIYVFNPTQQTSLNSFNTNQKYNYINKKELIKREVKGNYLITDHQFNAKELKDTLKAKGVNIKTYQLNRVMIAMGIIAEMNLVIPLIALVIIYLLYYIYEKNIHFKAYAVKTLHGYTLPKIIFEQFHMKCAYWFSLYIIQIGISGITLWLLGYSGNLKLYMIRLSLLSSIFIFIISFINLWTYLMLLNLNIAHMIKGKQHFKTIRLINTSAKRFFIGANGYSNYSKYGCDYRVE